MKEYSVTGVVATHEFSPPIFVVGAPRSGTTLLSAMLSSHSSIAIGPESHFFNKSTGAARREAVLALWPMAAVDLVMGIELTGVPVAHLYGLDRKDVEVWLEDRPPSEEAIFESLTQAFSEQKGKRRWGEKTPNHINHLKEIRRLYPEARIVHIVRDPRDSAASIGRLPWASASTLANAYLWRDWVRKGLDFAEADGNVLAIRFEDLLEQPAEQLRRVCDYVGESYEPTMLDTSHAAAEMRSSHETWKIQAGQELDPSKAYRWRSTGRTIASGSTRAISLICHREIEYFGYSDPVHPIEELYGLGLCRATVEASEAQLIRMAEGGVLISQRDGGRWHPQDLDSSDVILCGPPTLADSRSGNVCMLLHLAWRLSLRRAMGSAVYYLPTSVLIESSTARLAWAIIETLGKPSAS